MKFFGWGTKGYTAPSKPIARNGLYLDSATKGRTYTMLGLEGGQSFREKIYSMGLNPGARFRIIQNSGHGPIEVEVRQTKLAIGRGMASRIKIRENGATA